MKVDGDILSLNFNHNGFYRVLYDDSMFENISRNLSQITAEEKWGLANDLYAFLLSGKISQKQFYFLEGDKNSTWKIPLFINRFSSEEKLLMEGNRIVSGIF